MPAWISTACQFALILLGVLLVLKESPPAVLQRYLLSLF
jgi:hypothetical protein